MSYVASAPAMMIPGFHQAEADGRAIENQTMKREAVEYDKTLRPIRETAMQLANENARLANENARLKQQWNIEDRPLDRQGKELTVEGKELANQGKSTANEAAATALGWAKEDRPLEKEKKTLDLDTAKIRNKLATMDMSDREELRKVFIEEFGMTPAQVDATTKKWEFDRRLTQRTVSQIMQAQTPKQLVQLVQNHLNRSGVGDDGYTVTPVRGKNGLALKVQNENGDNFVIEGKPGQKIQETVAQALLSSLEPVEYFKAQASSAAKQAEREHEIEKLKIEEKGKTERERMKQTGEGKDLKNIAGALKTALTPFMEKGGSAVDFETGAITTGGNNAYTAASELVDKHQNQGWEPATAAERKQLNYAYKAVNLYEQYLKIAGERFTPDSASPAGVDRFNARTAEAKQYYQELIQAGTDKQQAQNLARTMYPEVFQGGWKSPQKGGASALGPSVPSSSYSVR